MSKKNTIKEESPFTEPKADWDSFTDPAKPKKGEAKGRFAFFKDERTHKVFGLFLLLFSLVMFASFTSYFSTWANDDSIRDLSWSEILSNTNIAHNWLGKIGALIGELFIKEWFGVSSYLIVFLLFITEIGRA